MALIDATDAFHITNILNECMQCIDFGDCERFQNLFTDDGTLHVVLPGTFFFH
jgi:hypothetical protein